MRAVGEAVGRGQELYITDTYVNTSLRAVNAAGELLLL